MSDFKVHFYPLEREKYYVTTRYIECQPDLCSSSRTFIQITLPINHPILDYIKPGLDEFEPMYTLLGIKNCHKYKPQYYLTAVRPFVDNIEVLTNVPRHYTLAWYINSNDEEEISTSFHSFIDWLESGIFIDETRKFEWLNKKRRQLYNLRSKRKSGKFSPREIKRLEREEIIHIKLNKADLDRRAPHFNFNFGPSELAP
jgi:hypothetical protein